MVDDTDKSVYKVVDETPLPELPKEMNKYHEYFNDLNYMNSLNILLIKLRRYRWIYYKSSEHYENEFNKYAYYPLLICGLMISVLSVTVANIDDYGVTRSIITYTIAILGFVINTLQRNQTKQQYELKKVRFDIAGKECAKLINKISHEIKSPDDDRKAFLQLTETTMEKIIDELPFRIPTFIEQQYHKLEAESPSDISSEDMFLKNDSNKKNVIASRSQMTKNCYDYDIETDIKARNELTEITQNIIQHLAPSDKYFRTKLHDQQSFSDIFRDKSEKKTKMKTKHKGSHILAMPESVALDMLNLEENKKSDTLEHQTIINIVDDTTSIGETRIVDETVIDDRTVDDD